MREWILHYNWIDNLMATLFVNKSILNKKILIE